MEADLDRIAELGCNVIRIGEFAWRLMEPEEGRYDFSFFDRVIEKAGERGLDVIFGTPTGRTAGLARVQMRGCAADDGKRLKARLWRAAHRLLQQSELP